MKKQAPNKKRIVIGITGSFGSGKSTVARMFYSSDAQLINADRLARSLLLPGNKVYQRLVRFFGRGILKKDRRIDRSGLAKVVFKNRRLLRQLNKLVHPEVIRIIKDAIAKSRRQFVILDAPLLVESGSAGMVDRLIVVKTGRKQQLRRLLKKTSLDTAQILARIKAQMPLEIKVRLADFVIDNSGTLTRTKRQVNAIRRQLWKN